MTYRKHLKTRVRARMAHTGERYATARPHVVGDDVATATPPPTGPGVNPATTALVALLERAGLPVPEPLALVVGGGVGMGVFHFHYAKEGVSTFFVAGRHRWEDDAAYLVDALRRLGLEPIVEETGSARVAERQLRTALADGGPVVAWVDAADLGTRGLPDEYRGGAYHVLVVRAIDDERGVATVDDVADAPLRVPLDTLARSRRRIAKDRNRLLWLAPGTTATTSVQAAIRSGLRATVVGLRDPRSRAFGLDALTDWATRLRAGGKDGWATVFPAGDRLWGAIAAIHRGVEHDGSGGGLVRPMFADGMRLAAAALENPSLDTIAQRYDDLGRAWSDLAAAALPTGVPAFRRTRSLQAGRAARYREAGLGAHDDLAASWQATAAIRAEVADCWPLDDAATAALKHDLADRIEAIAAAEREALDALAEVVDEDMPARGVAS